MSFNDLPTELLQHVGSYLDPQSAYSLGLTSRSGRVAAVPCIFRSILFQPDDRSTLERSVQSMSEVLDRASAFECVRSLEISGELHGELVEGPKESAQPEDDFCYWTTGHHISRREDDTNAHLAPWYGDDNPPDFAYEDDATWQPLAKLLDRLTGLEDLTFTSPHQFPPCMLKVLHARLPRCRLHIKCFHLRSLLDKEIDAHEYALATSPNLTTAYIRYRVLLRDETGNMQYDFNDLAALDMMAGLAPNLKDVRLEFWQPKFIINEGILSHQERHWIGLPRESPLRRGALETLEIDGGWVDDGLVTSECLARCAKGTDFSQLSNLYLQPLNLSAVLWLRTERSFRNLTTLKYSVNVKGAPQIPAQEMSPFLESLQPLQSLEVHGEFSISNMIALTKQQGDSAVLRRLHLLPRADKPGIRFTAGIIRRMQESFPNIEDLRLDIERDLGGRDEVAAYEALGKFSRLHTAYLALNCRRWDLMTLIEDDDLDNEEYEALTPLQMTWFDEFECQEYPSTEDSATEFENRPLNGHIVESLLNGAIDQRLALSIWDTINAARAPGCTQLRSLKLHPLGSCQFGEEVNLSYLPLQDAVSQMETSWHLERSIRDDESKPVVRLLFPNGAQYFRSAVKNSMENPDVKAVFEHTWPGIMDDGRDWRTSWYSRPLYNAVPPVLRIPWC